LSGPEGRRRRPNRWAASRAPDRLSLASRLPCGNELLAPAPGHRPGRLGSVGKQSAGILLYRRGPEGVEVLLGHMGGPFWTGRENGAWSVPKGEYDTDEDAEHAAQREFEEELGVPVPTADLIDLGAVRQSGGKVVTVWAAEGELDLNDLVYGTFTMEWPRGSGRLQKFPEIDAVAWFDLATARDKIIAGQRAFLDRLADHLATG
jgi:predicted NUDIX family NTP pyrophosphohydrolase